MNVEEIYKTIVARRPRVIYIGGKTSTGKSTFGRKLHDELGYHVIELEAVILDLVQTRGLGQNSAFDKIFYKPEDSEEKTLFFNQTDHIIFDALSKNHPVVIEGAVSDFGTLQRVLQPATNLFFLYFHPFDINVYIRNLTERFLQAEDIPYGGLPQKFWQLIDKDEYERFRKTKILADNLKNSIKQFALSSQKASLERLDIYRNNFKDINVIEIQ